MTISRRSATAAGLATVALVLGPASAMGADLSLSLCAPGQNTFTEKKINNAYFPLPSTGRWLLAGQEGGQSIALQITVQGTERFTFSSGTVTTRVLEEREWVDPNGNGLLDSGEQLVEVSYNYFAQTQPGGTVCYFGEFVNNYENGVVVNNNGSWRADGSGNAPGIFMPAAPKVGMTFQQEFAPGVAEDQAKIVGSGSVKVPAGTFRDTVRVQEFNPLDGSKDEKVYARGVGLITDATLALQSSSLTS